ncbi:major facilitator superfamily domain-containing protein [Xylaria palmicola]|nr:major facilitator superfamily domain-containing protein [Xylaria palmicola]
MATQSPPDERYREDEIAESTEETPFIPEAEAPSRAQRHGRGRRARASSIASLGSAAPKVRRHGGIVAILCAVLFVASSSGGFHNMSATRIFEDILCRRYYGRVRGDGQPIDEEMCKVDAIQSELAYLFAVQNSLNAAVSLVAALPWGIAADKIGRRLVFAIGMTGMSLSALSIIVVGWFDQVLSPRLMWLSPISLLLGGGNPILAATIMSIAVDVVPESERSTSFMRLHGASMVGNLISPALAALLMASAGPWPSIFLGFLLLLLPAFAIFIVPETLKHDQRAEGDERDSSTFKAHLVQSLRELRKSASAFGSRSMIIVLLITMLQLSLVICTFQFLSQFASKRYNIPLADTGFIQSAYGVAFITVSFFIMPWIASEILKPGAPAFIRFDDNRQRDLFLARGSYVASLIGTFILGLSGSLPGFVFGLAILAFGVSGEGFLKSIATLHVTVEQRSRLFTILGLSAIASDLWISPALAALFSLGMRLGGIWIGLPYFGVSGLCVIMVCMAVFIRLPQAPPADEEYHSDPERIPNSE